MIYDRDTPHLASNFGSDLLSYSQQYSVNAYCLVVSSLFPALCSFYQLCEPLILTYLVISNCIQP